MGLSFHDEKSLEDVVGSLQFAPDRIDTGIDTGIESINDIELLDKDTF